PGRARRPAGIPSWFSRHRYDGRDLDPAGGGAPQARGAGQRRIPRVRRRTGPPGAGAAWPRPVRLSRHRADEAPQRADLVFPAHRHRGGRLMRAVLAWIGDWLPPSLYFALAGNPADPSTGDPDMTVL